MTYDEFENMVEESSLESDIRDMRGTIDEGDCMFCGRADAMKYEGGVCFVCRECNMSVDEDTYYAWLLGVDVEFEDMD